MRFLFFFFLQAMGLTGQARGRSRLATHTPKTREDASRLATHTPTQNGRTYTRFGGGPGKGGRGGGSRSPLSPRARRFRTYATGAALAGGSVVWYSSREEIPFSHRMHAILITTDMERQLGESTFAQITQEATRNGTLLPRHHPATRAVERVGRRLAAVASDGAGGGASDHMKGLDWEFVVIDDDQCNAFVVPGGKVVVYTGVRGVVWSWGGVGVGRVPPARLAPLSRANLSAL